MKRVKRRSVNYSDGKAEILASDRSSAKETLIKMEKLQSYTKSEHRSSLKNEHRSTLKNKIFIEMANDEDETSESVHEVDFKVTLLKNKRIHKDMEQLEESPEVFFAQLEAIMRGEFTLSDSDDYVDDDDDDHNRDDNDNDNDDDDDKLSELQSALSRNGNIYEAEEVEEDEFEALEEQQNESLYEERLFTNSKVSLQSKTDNRYSDQAEVAPDIFFEQLDTVMKNENLLNTLEAAEELEDASTDHQVGVDIKEEKKRVTTELETPKLKELMPELSGDDDSLTFLSNDEEDKEKETTESLSKEEFSYETENEEDLQSQQHEEDHNLILSDITEFINDLMTTAVHKSINIKPKEFLRRNLDKLALMKEILEKLAELELERKVQKFVNKRIADHFRRKARFSVFFPDNPDTVDLYVQRYQDALERLENNLHKEAELRANFEKEREMLEQKKSMLSSKEQEKLAEFEQLIRETFRNNKGPKKMVINSELKQMRDMRDDISATRLSLLEAQHTSVRLTEKLGKVEKVSVNLYLRHYERLQNEIQNLGKRIEERKSDLAKTFAKYNRAIHIRTHIKEEQAIRLYEIDIKRSLLEQLQEEKREARKRVVFQKKERLRLRKEIKNLRFQSGIVEKPALILDYDATVEQIEKTSKNIQQLREKHDDILRKIAYYENKLRFK